MLLLTTALRIGEALVLRWEQVDLTAAMTRATLPPLTPHGSRHTRATLLLGAGVPDRAIQDMLGHAKLSATMAVYAHGMTPSIRGRATP